MYLYSCQVLSESVCTAMYFTNDPEMVETRRFVCMFDRFFDCMNVSNFGNGKHKRKVFQQPYRSSGDFRLKVYLSMQPDDNQITVYIFFHHESF